MQVIINSSLFIKFRSKVPSMVKAQHLSQGSEQTGKVAETFKEKIENRKRGDPDPPCTSRQSAQCAPAGTSNFSSRSAHQLPPQSVLFLVGHCLYLPLGPGAPYTSSNFSLVILLFFSALNASRPGLQFFLPAFSCLICFSAWTDSPAWAASPASPA